MYENSTTLVPTLFEKEFTKNFTANYQNAFGQKYSKEIFVKRSEDSKRRATNGFLV